MSQVTANSTNPTDAMEAPVAKNVNLNRGKLGMTCIGRSADEAEQVYARTKARLLGDH